MRRNRCLLVLDGLEPHQWPIASEGEGELRDDVLKAFVTGLADTPGHGLTVIAFATRAIDLLRGRRPWRLRLLERKMIDMQHHRMSSHATLGCLLHYQGQLPAAEQMFLQAEHYQRIATPYPRLRAIWGYRYIDLLLDLERFEDADEYIADAFVDPDEPAGWGEGVFALPLIQLAYVRSKIRQADVLARRADWNAAVELAGAFSDFGRGDRRLRMDWLVPSFRVASAGVARLSGKLSEAAAYINDARQLATDGQVNLFDFEIALERAKICLACGQRGEAARVLGEAQGLSTEVAYRRGAVDALAASLVAQR